jgi:cysteinyl-tRNA synthetase
MVKADLPDSQKAGILLEMDKVLGLDLEKYLGQKLEIPKAVLELVKKRERARIEKDFEKSDELRKEIKKLGFEVEDSENESRIKKA